MLLYLSFYIMQNIVFYLSSMFAAFYSQNRRPVKQNMPKCADYRGFLQYNTALSVNILQQYNSPVLLLQTDDAMSGKLFISNCNDHIIGMRIFCGVQGGVRADRLHLQVIIFPRNESRILLTLCPII